MVKIKKEEQLPEWFSIDKYKGCAELSLHQWSELLSYRSALDYSLRLKEHLDKIPRLLEHTRNKPLDEFQTVLYKNNEGKFVWQGTNEQFFRTALQGNLFKAAYSLSCSDLAHMYERLPKCAREEAFESYEWVEKTASSQIDIDENIELVAINLNRPDSEIEQAIRDIIEKNKSRRANPARKPRFEGHLKWAKSGVLPFLDLKIWELETENKITDSLYASVLQDYYNIAFKNGEEKDFSEDTVRSTVLKSSLKLISIDYLRWLSVQAGNDQGVSFNLDESISEDLIKAAENGIKLDVFDE